MIEVCVENVWIFFHAPGNREKLSIITTKRILDFFFGQRSVYTRISSMAIEWLKHRRF